MTCCIVTVDFVLVGSVSVDILDVVDEIGTIIVEVS